jgi:Fe-S-cluster containining protein
VTTPDTLLQAVHAAAARPEVLAAVAELYGQMEQAILQRRPICRQSGRCCHFDAWGHRLMVTTLELAAFLAHRPRPVVDPPPGGCPFQSDKLCTVHPLRPLGCRVYYCDATATAWQQEQYRACHHALRQLHEDLAVPYHYVEWRQALAVLQPIMDIAATARSTGA